MFLVNELQKLEKPVTRAAPAGAVLLFKENVMEERILGHKTFLDYSNQIQYLKYKKLKIEDIDKAIYILNKVGYYNLINGYKDTFKDVNTHDFLMGTTFSDIYNLYTFDSDLREVFLKYILIFEKHIKSSISYHFSNLYGSGRAELSKILIILTKIRNICAHGNRLFNTHIQDALPDSIIHKKLCIPKTGPLYQFGKSDLFAAVISLKYVLSIEDFRAFYYALKKVIKGYNPSEEIMIAMGFPANWMSILRIKLF